MIKAFLLINSCVPILKFSFRRRIIGNLSLMFEDLLGCCNNHSLSDQDDRIIWCLDKKGFFCEFFV
jgi:hypothetical protein